MPRADACRRTLTLSPSAALGATHSSIKWRTARIVVVGLTGTLMSGTPGRHPSITRGRGVRIPATTTHTTREPPTSALFCVRGRSRWSIQLAASSRSFRWMGAHSALARQTIRPSACASIPSSMARPCVPASQATPTTALSRRNVGTLGTRTMELTPLIGGTFPHDHRPETPPP